MYSARSYKTLDLPNEISLENFEPNKAKDDQKMIAPMELLARFLSTIMEKDYENALVFCKLSKFYGEILSKVLIN